MPTVPKPDDFGPSLVGVRGTSPRLAAAKAGANAEIGAGFASLGQAITQEGVRFQRVRQEQMRRTRVTEISTELSRRTHERRLELLRDPGDPETLLDRFREGAELDFEELTADVQDTELLTRVRERALPHLESQAQELSLFSFRQEQEAAKAADISEREEVIREAVLADDPEERAEILDAYLAPDKPYFSPAERHAAEVNLRSRVNTLVLRDEVNGLVEAGDFEGAMERAESEFGNQFVRAEDVQRTREFIASKAREANKDVETDREQERKRANTATTNQIIGALARTEIERSRTRDPARIEAIEAQRDALVEEIAPLLPDLERTLNREQYNAVLRSIKGAVVPGDDPTAIPQLLRAMRDPTQTPSEREALLLDFYNDGRLTQSTYEKYTNQLESLPSSVEQSLDEIEASFAVRFGEDPVVKRRLEESAKQEFYAFVQGNPQATPREIAEARERILRRHEVTDSLATLPIPDALRTSFRERSSAEGFSRFRVQADDVQKARARVYFDDSIPEEEKSEQLEVLDSWLGEIERRERARERQEALLQETQP